MHRDSGTVTAVLCLTAIQSIDAFAGFARGGVAGFTTVETSEPHSLILKRNESSEHNAAATPAAAPDVIPGTPRRLTRRRTAEVDKIILIAGRQIATRDGLEILALGTRDHFEDGAGIEETLAHLAETRTRAVLPWGFGKWIGRRGRIVRDLIQDIDPKSGFALGDSANRPMSWPAPPQFDIAEDRAIPVLPGTDPLPLTGEHLRTASFGFTAPLPLSASTPWADLDRWISDNPREIVAFGERSATSDALRSQLVLRLS